MDQENLNYPIPNITQYEDGIPCCFTQIQDLASSINIKEINTDTSKYKYESKQNKEGKPQNCT
jgi:hypothetical protein